MFCCSLNVPAALRLRYWLQKRNQSFWKQLKCALDEVLQQLSLKLAVLKVRKCKLDSDQLDIESVMCTWKATQVRINSIDLGLQCI